MTAAMASHRLALILFLVLSIKTAGQSIRPVSQREELVGVSI